MTKKPRRVRAPQKGESSKVEPVVVNVKKLDQLSGFKGRFRVRPHGQSKLRDPDKLPVRPSRALAGVSKTPGKLRQAVDKLDKILLGLADLPSARRRHFESIYEYWGYLLEHTKPYLISTSPSLNSWTQDSINEEGRRFARIFLDGIETLEDLQTYPTFASIDRTLRELIKDDRIIELLFYYIHKCIDGILAEYREPLKRKYRIRAELPDPTKPADAEVNRSTQQVKLRVDPKIAEAIDNVVAESGVTRSDWYVEAALEKIKRDRPDVHARLSQPAVPQPK